MLCVRLPGNINENSTIFFLDRFIAVLDMFGCKNNEKLSEIFEETVLTAFFAIKLGYLFFRQRFTIYSLAVIGCIGATEFFSETFKFIILNCL